MEKLLLYSAQLNNIGGIERFDINFCKRMSKYFDITFVYDTADKERLSEIKKYASVEENKGKPFSTDICLYSTAWGKIDDYQIDARDYRALIHADLTQYKHSMFFNYIRRPLVAKHACVGKNVANSLKIEYGITGTVIYNLLDNDIKYEKHIKKRSKDVLNIIVLSRISGEKGFERLIKFLTTVKKSGRKVKVTVYGDSYDGDYERSIKSQMKMFGNFVEFKGAIWNVTQALHDADYLFQLSDTEGMPYSPREALQVGTPVVLTDFPAAHEIVKDGVNGYILDMNLKNLDLNKLFNEIPIDFEYKEESTEQDWIDFLKYNPNEMFKVKNTAYYTDLRRNKDFDVNDPPRLESLSRALELIKRKFCKFVIGNKEETKIKQDYAIDQSLQNILSALKK